MDVEVSLITPRLQNTEYHDSCSGLALYAITAVDWLEPQIQSTQKQQLSLVPRPFQWIV